MEWFNSNFSGEIGKIDYYNNVGKLRMYLLKRDGKELDSAKSSSADSMKRVLRMNYFLNGEVSKQYLDYLELKESRISAERVQTASIEANKKSSTSIKLAIFAIIAGLVGTIITVVQNCYNPNPPYEVKVIEDRPRTIELEKDNKQLKEELIKAQMAVKVLEIEFSSFMTFKKKTGLLISTVNFNYLWIISFFQ